jgi:hypothetical protein
MRAGFVGRMSAGQRGAIAPRNISNYFAHYKASSSVVEYVTQTETVLGTLGANTLTFTADQTATLFPTMLIRVAGTDVYTVLSVSTVTVTIVGTLSATYPALTAVAIQRVSQWTDLSGNGLHATGEDASEPSYIPVWNNGQPAIRFRAGRFLTLPTGFYSNFASGANTAIVIAQCDAQDTGNQAFFALNGSGLVKVAFYLGNTAGGNVNYRSANSAAAAAATGDITQTNMSFYHGRRTGTTQAVAQNNGTEATNTNAVDTVADAGRIGVTPTDTFAFTGKISEMIFYNKSLIAAELAALYSYTRSTYTIS